MLLRPTAAEDNPGNSQSCSNSEHVVSGVHGTNMPPHPEHRYSVISNTTAQLSGEAAASTIAKATTCHQPPAKAGCEPQDLRRGGGEVTGGLAGVGAVNTACSPLSYLPDGALTQKAWGKRAGQS